MSGVKVLSVREDPSVAHAAVKYIQAVWPDVPPMMYENSVLHSLETANPIPHWYVLQAEDEIVGCAGLITNDFISRMDLWPWLCALYVDPAHRGRGYARLLIDKAIDDAAHAGFPMLYLSTDHVGLYERIGFTYIGDGYHPWDEKSRIYSIPTSQI